MGQKGRRSAFLGRTYGTSLPIEGSRMTRNLATEICYIATGNCYQCPIKVAKSVMQLLLECSNIRVSKANFQSKQSLQLDRSTFHCTPI